MMYVQFIISIRSGRKFYQAEVPEAGRTLQDGRSYRFKDERLAELMEKMIGDTRGHAIVERFKDRQILIENIMFGEIIRMVEISGSRAQDLIREDHPVTAEEMIRAFRSSGRRREFRCFGWSSITSWLC